MLKTPSKGLDTFKVFVGCVAIARTQKKIDNLIATHLKQLLSKQPYVCVIPNPG